MKNIQYLLIPIILFLSVPNVFGQESNTGVSNSTEIVKEINEQELNTFIENIQTSVGSSFEDKSLVLENKMVIEEIKNAINKNIINEKNNKKATKFLTEKIKLAYKNKLIKEIQIEIQRQEDKGLPAYIIQPGDKISLIAEAMDIEPKVIITENNLMAVGTIDFSYQELYTNKLILKDPIPELKLESLKFPQDNDKLDKLVILFPGDLLVGIFSLKAESNVTQEQVAVEQEEFQKSDDYNADDTNEEIILEENTTETNNSTSLYHAKESAKNLIIGLNITSDQYNELIMQIEEAKDLSTIDNIIIWAKDLAKENEQPTTNELQAHKDSAISLVSSYNLSEEQLNEVISLINSATTLDEINSAISYADTLSNNP